MKPVAPEITADWRSFEQAVTAFHQALDPNAKIIHDYRTPDGQTGLPRQRDVWIEMPVFGGLSVLKVLISCKRKKSRMSQQDIDHFSGELIHSGAHMGLLYAHGGFTKPALIKAKALGISCCSLYENRPADMPEVLRFDAYCFRERCRIDALGLTVAKLGVLLDAPLASEGGRTVLARLVADYDVEREATMAVATETLRPTWEAALGLDVGDGQTVTIRLSSAWSVYRAKPEAWFLNGAYSFTQQVFAGEMSTPFVDQGSTHPGPGWNLIEADEIDTTRARVLIYSHGGEFASGPRAWVAENAAA